MIKDKNRLSKIIAGVILSSFISAVVGFLMSDAWNLRAKEIDIAPTYIVLIFGILTILLNIVIIVKIETVDEYRYEVTKLLGDGFIKIYRDSISEFATTLVNRSKYVRVVGTARQDVVNSRSMKGAQDYLKALEKKLEKPCKDSANTFTYYRVVPKTASLELENHIEKCKDLAKTKGNRFDVKTNLIFPFYISFQIFDDTDLLIILDNKGMDKKNDNALCLWSRNKEIIDTFIKRFDNGWEE